MEEQVKSISSLIAALETRNELLHEEIKRNEEAIKKMEYERLLIEDVKVEDKQKDSKVEMVA
ncbi:MAG: hypothetical protein K6C11_04175 [Bacilli bacterium]|nr:hypothetical protein [Bacilli bacterium]